MAMTFWEEDAIRTLREPGQYVVLTRSQADLLADYIDPLESNGVTTKQELDEANQREAEKTEELKQLEGAADKFFEAVGAAPGCEILIRKRLPRRAAK